MANVKAAAHYKGINLSSLTATKSSTFSFSQVSALPLAAFRCLMPLAACLTIKQWLIARFDTDEYAGSDLLRSENLELDTLQPACEGTLLLLEGAATVQSPYAPKHNSAMPVGIMALLMPKDHRVRFFYSIQSFSKLLIELEGQGMISMQCLWEPGTKDHQRIVTFVRTEFLKAVEIPDHPDYINAKYMEDCAPEIRDADSALGRLESSEFLYFQKDGIDLSDDRYLLELHPAERHIASLVELHCAEYLLVKRMFFKEFYVAVYRSDKNIEKGQKARTEHAHQKWLEDVYSWPPTRAKKLVIGWKILGLLDEKRYLPWLRKGGMLSQTGFWEDEEVKEKK